LVRRSRGNYALSMWHEDRRRACLQVASCTLSMVSASIAGTSAAHIRTNASLTADSYDDTTLPTTVEINPTRRYDLCTIIGATKQWRGMHSALRGTTKIQKLKSFCIMKNWKLFSNITFNSSRASSSCPSCHCNLLTSRVVLI